MDDKPLSVRQAPEQRRTYTLEFKLGVLEWLKKHKSSVRATARRFSVHRRMVQRWLDSEIELSSAVATRGSKCKKLGKGRPPLSIELEELLLSWSRTEQGSTGCCVSDKRLKEKALELAEELQLINFKASFVWLKAWKRRSYTHSDKELSPLSSPLPQPFNGEAFLTHLNPNDTAIKLIFNDDQFTQSPPTNHRSLIYYDYNTQEHNYCSPFLSSAECVWLSNTVLIDANSEDLILAHEETIGYEGERSGLKIVIESGTGTVDKRMPRPLPFNEGVFAVASRLTEPVFPISPPEIVF